MNGIARAWLILALLWPLYGNAHSGSASYITVVDGGESTSIAISLDLLDLHYALDLDANADGLLKWSEIVRAEARLYEFAANGLSIVRGDALCPITFSDIQVEHIDDLVYLVLDGRSKCARKGQATLRSTMFFDLDSDHRSLVSWRHGTSESLAVMSARQRSVQSPTERNVVRPLGDAVRPLVDGEVTAHAVPGAMIEVHAVLPKELAR